MMRARSTGLTALAALTLMAFPLGTAIAAGTMLVAGVSMQRTAGTFWNAGGGGEYPFYLALTALVLGLTGPGTASIDSLIDAPWHDTSGLTVGVIAGAVAVLAALPPLIRGRASAPP